jgi:hypothetical protein
MGIIDHGYETRSGILKALETIAVSQPKNVENMTEENVSGK